MQMPLALASQSSGNSTQGQQVGGASERGHATSGRVSVNNPQSEQAVA
ncbi:hypothetical protein [Staphylococcus pseudintermedius]|nr:hypothetical protein [Staphylococcus pseudintermedius]